MEQAPGEWREVEVAIERPSPVDPNGPCANSRPQDDHKTITLPPGKCLNITFHVNSII